LDGRRLTGIPHYPAAELVAHPARAGYTGRCRASGGRPLDALLVVDMQCGLLAGPPKHDLDGVVGRINALAAAIRTRGGAVVWIRHCGPAGDAFAAGRPGWAFLPALAVQPDDAVVEKRLNDAFAGTGLQQSLQALSADRLVVAGWATDFCVNSTVRSAVSNGWRVAVASDAHTLGDRPMLDAPTAIAYHNWMWGGLIAAHPVAVQTTQALLDEAAQRQPR